MAAVATPATVAESDVVRGGEARRVWGVDACGPAVIHGARTAANAADPGVAVGDHSVSSGTLGERVDRLADKAQLGVGVRDPVHHLLGGHEVRRGQRDEVGEWVLAWDRGKVFCPPCRCRRTRVDPHCAVDISAALDDRNLWTTYYSKQRGHADASRSKYEEGEAREGVRELHSRDTTC